MYQLSQRRIIFNDIQELVFPLGLREKKALFPEGVTTWTSPALNFTSLSSNPRHFSPEQFHLQISITWICIHPAGAQEYLSPGRGTPPAKGDLGALSEEQIHTEQLFPDSRVFSVSLLDSIWSTASVATFSWNITNHSCPSIKAQVYISGERHTSWVETSKLEAS